MTDLFSPDKSVKSTGDVKTIQTTRKDTKPDMSFASPGGYRVQYSDDAIKHLEKLPDETRIRIIQKINTASVANPYRESTQEGELTDRVRMTTEDASALVWISSGVRVLTVVQIDTEPRAAGT